MTRKIVTHHEFPPIPVREFDWCAHYEGQEEAGHYGWGSTEAEAIADFNENQKHYHDDLLSEPGEILGVVQIDEVDMEALVEPIVVAFAAASDYRALVMHGWSPDKAREIVTYAASGDPDAKRLVDRATGKVPLPAPDPIVAYTMFGRLP